MANIIPHMNKLGEITSYTIRVYHGYDHTGKRLKPFTMNYQPHKGMSRKQADKEVNRQAVQFEEKCQQGYTLDNKRTFAEYAEYVVALKKRAGIKYSTLYWYKNQLRRINAIIGDIKLNEIRPQHLNKLYEQLSSEGIRESGMKCRCKIDLRQALKNKKTTQTKFSADAGISEQTLRSCCKGNFISYDAAIKIAKSVDKPLKNLFDILCNSSELSQTTISGYHRCISSILSQAEKEMLIPYNPAEKATPPKKEKSQPNYFQPEDIASISEALETVSLKWKVIIHLLLISGARRGEIAGLKWSVIDWENNRIHIQSELLNKPIIGLYEDTVKTQESDRFITLPLETMELLREYQQYWIEFRQECGSKWNSFLQIPDGDGKIKTIKAEYLFFQQTGKKVGYPTKPDSITKWCNDFSRKNGLPHINPHAFRHTMASMLYFYNIDSISISARLGHSRVSTTTDIYSHVIKESDKRSAECIADVVIRNKNYSQG